MSRDRAWVLLERAGFTFKNFHDDIVGAFKPPAAMADDRVRERVTRINQKQEGP